MTLEDCYQAQGVDSSLSLAIARLRDGMLGKSQSKGTDPPKSVNLGENGIIMFLKRVLYTGKPE